MHWLSVCHCFLILQDYFFSHSTYFGWKAGARLQDLLRQVPLPDGLPYPDAGVQDWHPEVLVPAGAVRGEVKASDDTAGQGG